MVPCHGLPLNVKEEGRKKRGRCVRARALEREGAGEGAGEGASEGRR